MLNDTALVLGANAIMNAITHVQAHSAAPGVAGTANVVGSRVAATAAAVDADADITLTANFTGLNPNQPVTHVSYWSAANGGTCYGSTVLGDGDTSANAAGEFTASVAENGSAT